MQDSLQEAASERLTENIASWLPAPDPSTNLAAASNKRQPDTGKWLLTSEIFLNWKKAACSFLWLYGKAGAGKTVLSATAINYLSDTCDDKSVILCFYFDFNDHEKQLVQNLLRHIIVQLSNRSKSAAKIVVALYNARSRGSTKPTFLELKDIVRRVIENSPSMYLIIDALDECQERKALLEFLIELKSWNQANLHILATSRQETDIEDSLSAVATHQISLEESVIDGDILSYVGHQLQYDAKLSKWSVDVRNEIQTTLMEGANGMFRWVECQLDAIRGCMKPALLRKTLRSLPKTLDDTYARILDNVGEDYVEDVRRVLACLICSSYPLAIQELAETVAIVPQGEMCFDTENRLLEPRNILTICSGLVTTIKSRRVTLMGGPQIPIEEVRLAHFSVKEYLVSDRLSSKANSKFYIEERLTHEVLANLSLRYLVYCHQARFCEDPEFLLSYETAFLDKVAFAPYAASFWSHHLRAARLDSSSPLYQECLEMFTSPALLKDMIRLRRPWFRSEEVTIMRRCGYIKNRGWWDFQYDLEFEAVPPLYYASLLGLSQLATMLIGAGEDVDCSTCEGTCLVAAASEGHRSIVESLLAKGADVNLRVLQVNDADNIYYSGTPLHEAVLNGHEAIARVLLAAGADVNIGRWPPGSAGIRDSSNTPLQAAVLESSPELVELLLGAGADPNACAGFMRSALESAAFLTHDNIIMTLLLDAGADPNRMPCLMPGLSLPDILTPLFITLVHNNLSGARLLVERGVDPQTIDSRIVIPIIRNTINNRNKFQVTIETLIQIKPEMNLELALIAAAKYGHVEGMDIILQHGTSPNAQDGSETAALHAAAFTPACDAEAVQVLLDARANVNIQGGPLGSALQAAALTGKLQVVKLLLGKGASIYYSGGLYGSALQIARDRLKDQEMECPEYWTWKPAIGIVSYGAPKGYPHRSDYLEERRSPYKSPKDATYEAKINIAHLQSADYQAIIDLLLTHGATDV